MNKVATLLQYFRAVFFAAVVTISLVTGSTGIAKAQTETASNLDQSNAVPKNLNDALLLSLTAKQQNATGLILESHTNSDRALLTDTNSFTTPNYNWGVALAYPDFCSYETSPYWLANIVYVVRGRVIEIDRVPFGGTSSKQSVTHTLDSVIVRVDAVFDHDDCSKSTISATVISR